MYISSISLSTFIQHSENSHVKYQLDPPEKCHEVFGVYPDAVLEQLVTKVRLIVKGSVPEWVPELGLIRRLLFYPENGPNHILYFPENIKNKQDLNGYYKIISSLPAKDHKSIQLPVEIIANRVKELGQSTFRKDTQLEAEGQITPAHAWWLKVSSPYFQGLLNSSFKQAQEQTIKINGYSAKDVKLVIDHLYDPSKPIHLHTSNVVDIYSLAHEFQIPDLAAQCSSFFKKILNKNNVLHYFHLFATIDVSQHGLAQEVCRFLYMHAKRALIVPDAIARIPDIQTLKSLLQVQMNLPEIDLFLFVDQWIKAQQPSLPVSDIQDILACIQFEYIDLLTFWSKVAPIGYFSDQDMSAWSQTFVKISNQTYRTSRRQCFLPGQHLMPAFIKIPFNELPQYFNAAEQKRQETHFSLKRSIENLKEDYENKMPKLNL